MNVIFSAVVLVIAIFWAMVTTVAGLIAIPFILLVSVLFPIPKVRSSESMWGEESTILPPKMDHSVDVDIDTVPPMYYQEYSKYLKSDEWRALRKQVLKRDKYRCVDCGYIGKLQVHHLHYNGIETMTFTPEQCVSVCHTCHDKRHGRS